MKNGKIEYKEYKKLVVHIRMTKSTKCLRNDANKGSRIDELSKIFYNSIRNSINEYQAR